MKIEELIKNYDGLLIDAYGVLVHDKGCYSGAHDIVNLLIKEDIPYLVVTNDASRTIGTLTRRFHQLGLDIPEEKITSAGSMLTPYFEQQKLQGKNTIVLGNLDTVEMAKEAGAQIIGVDAPVHVDVVIIGDEVRVNLLEKCEAILSRLVDAYDEGRHVELIVPNSDIIYPKEAGFGFTAGAFANMIQEGLHTARPSCTSTFQSLGKPEAYLYENAKRILGSSNLLMVGDQLLTDILGARDMGLDSLLICGGIAKYDPGHEIQPSFVCNYFSVDEAVERVL